MIVWERVIELIGFEDAEKLRQEFAGMELKVPKRIPKAILAPAVKRLLPGMSYEHMAKVTRLSVRTIRRYEKSNNEKF